VIIKNIFHYKFLKYLAVFLFITQLFALPAEAMHSELTVKEIAWLKKHKEIVLGTDSNWEPYVIVNRDGSLSGFDKDILDLINKRTGANFKLTAGRWNDMIKKAKDKVIDGLSTSAANKERSKFLNYSYSYFTLSKLLIVESRNPKNIKSVNDLEGKRVGYQDGNLFDKNILLKYKNVIPVPVKSLKDITKFLVTGKIDAAIAANSIYYTAQENIPFLKTVDIFPESALNLVFSVRKDYPEAISIINKGLSSITVNEKSKLIEKWFLSMKYQMGENTELLLSEEEKRYLESKPYITVGNMTNFHPFNFLEDGKASGYSMDYMKLVGRALNKEIRFKAASWSDLLTMLKKGEIDVIPHIAVSDERKKFTEYTDFNHITYFIGFAVNKGDEFESMNHLKGKTLALVKDYVFQKMIEKLYPDIKLLLVKNTKEAVEAVAKRKAYAAFENIPALNHFIQKQWLSNLKVVTVNDLAFSDHLDLPMGVSKKSKTLKTILEKVESALPSQEVHKLKSKWIFGATTDKHVLSFAEKEFVKKHPVIRFKIRPDRPPFEFVQDGNPAGLVVDYITAVCKFSGIKPEFIISSLSTEESYNVVEGDRKLFDTLAYSVKSQDRMKRFIFGDNFISYPMMIITHKDAPFIGKTSDLNGKLVAVEKGYLTNKWLRRDYPAIDIVSADSTVDALRMVNDGKVDAYIGNVAVANYMMTHGGFDNIKIIAPSDYGIVNFSFVAPKEWPELASILSKGYANLSQGFHSSLQQKWFSLQVVERIDYQLIWKILLTFAFLGIWVIWWNRKLIIAKRETEDALDALQETKELLEKQNEKLELLSVTDRLTGIYNRLKLDSVLLAELNRSVRYEKSIFGVLILDIDHFKNVNDTYGHQTGDRVLISIAEILSDNVRTVDTVGRWGGEEFLIICPQTDKEGLLTVAENLRRTIELCDFDSAGKITASFGAAIYTDGDKISSIISRADEALYKSKENGRNRVTFI